MVAGVALIAVQPAPRPLYLYRTVEICPPGQPPRMRAEAPSGSAAAAVALWCGERGPAQMRGEVRPDGDPPAPLAGFLPWQRTGGPVRPVEE